MSAILDQYANGANHTRIIEEATKPSSIYRSEFRRDYARILHSQSFRRLQGKTQLFPSNENDFFRNRITHTLEVCQIAKSIALKLNQKYRNEYGLNLDTDLIEAVCLAHDIGHPPFGHTGEKVLDCLMAKHGGFEGNAQTFRILTKLEKKLIYKKDGGQIDRPDFSLNNGALLDNRAGLNLTIRALASVVKYDKIKPVIDFDEDAFSSEFNLNTWKVEKGIYEFDYEVVKKIKNLLLVSDKLYTIECAIMDYADDIANSSYDLEDGLKSGFISMADFFTTVRDLENPLSKIIYKDVKNKIEKAYEEKVSPEEIRSIMTYWMNDALFTELINSKKESIGYPDEFYDILLHINNGYRELGNNGFYRIATTSYLVDDAIENIDITFPPKPITTKLEIKIDSRIKVEFFKSFCFHKIIKSPRIEAVSVNGIRIIKGLFDLLKKDTKLLPADFQEIVNIDAGNESHVCRTICDYIAGMTDRYAIEQFCRFYSENPITISKSY